jgi:hypothetical protein
MPYLAGTGFADPGRSTTPADTAAASGTWTPLGTRTPASTDPSTPRRTGPMQIHTDQLHTPTAVPGNAAVTATKRHGTQHAGRLETGSYRPNRVQHASAPASPAPPARSTSQAGTGLAPCAGVGTRPRTPWSSCPRPHSTATRTRTDSRTSQRRVGWHSRHTPGLD